MTATASAQKEPPHELPGLEDVMIETDRLIMRPHVHGDAETLARILSDERVGKNLALIPCPCPVSFTEQWAVDAPKQIASGSAYLLTIIDRASNTIVGSCGVDELIEQGVSGREYDLGYFLDPSVWGQGLATQCAQALRDWAFTTLKVGSLRASCRMDNKGSARVLGKTGFHFLNTVYKARPAHNSHALVNRFRMDKPRWETLTRAAS